MPLWVCSCGEDFNFDDIELVLPTTVFEAPCELNLDGTEVHLIYVGPCHQLGDTIVHVPKERVVFAGDVVWRNCTPMGWTGSYEKWFQCLDLITQLNPEVIVPGHGPVCGLEGINALKEYLRYVRSESRKYFDDGLTALEAARRIEYGPYSEWRAPARLYMNIERAYREFRNEPADVPGIQPPRLMPYTKWRRRNGWPLSTDKIQGTQTTFTSGFRDELPE